MLPLSPSLSFDLAEIRKKAPVVLSLTNLVAMDLNANALLAVGASPIMAVAAEELYELTTIASAVVINLGTLDKPFIDNARFVLRAAKELGKPVVLDPVGAGASALRTQTAIEFFESGLVTALRANASETLAVLRGGGKSKGVDSGTDSEGVFETVKAAARSCGVTLVMSGKTDFIFCGDQTAAVEGGDSLLTKVTAMGCTASALYGAFLSVNPSAFEAGKNTMELMARTAEWARGQTSRPGSFRQYFVDGLHEAV